MSDVSVRDGVLDHLVDTLKNINGEVGGYVLTAGSLVQRDPFNIAGLPCPVGKFLACIEPTSTGAYEFTERPNRIKDTLDVLLTVRSEAQGNAVDRKSKLAETILADLERALVVDLTRGNRAIDTTIGKPTTLFSIGTDNIVVVLQPVTVKIRRFYGRP